MKWQMEPASANAVNSIVYILSAVASPVFGFLVDRTGRNIVWVTVGTLTTLGSHAMLAFTFINPYVSMVNVWFCCSIYVYMGNSPEMST